MTICTICDGPFDPDTEGGCEGDIGMLPVAFCPTCKVGICDFASQAFGMMTFEEWENYDADQSP